MKKIPYLQAQEILERFELGPEAQSLIEPTATPLDVMNELAKHLHLADYVNFVAHALPPREGICWALAIQEEMSLADVPDAKGIRGQVRTWVQKPTEALRRSLMELGEKLGTDGPTGWLCFAVAWNGSGSIADASGPVVLPPSYLHAKALLGAIALAPAETTKDIRQLLDLAHRNALAVAEGVWPGMEV